MFTLSKDDPSSVHSSVPPARSPPASTTLEPNQVKVSVLGITGDIVSVVLNLLDLAICDDIGDLIQSIKQCPNLSLEGPYNDSALGLEGWQGQDTIVGIEVSDSAVIQDTLPGVGGPKVD
jgi:hypothetical protein